MKLWLGVYTRNQRKGCTYHSYANIILFLLVDLPYACAHNYVVALLFPFSVPIQNFSLGLFRSSHFKHV